MRLFEWNIKVIHKTQSLCCCLGNFFSGQMGIQTGEGMEWETSVRRGKSADADAGGSRRGACVSSRTQYTYKHTHAYVCVCLTGRGRTTHTIYQHALEVSVCVCVWVCVRWPAALRLISSCIRYVWREILTELPQQPTHSSWQSHRLRPLSRSPATVRSRNASLSVSLFHSYSRRVLGSMTISIPIAFCDRRLRLLRVQQA